MNLERLFTSMLACNNPNNGIAPIIIGDVSDLERLGMFYRKNYETLAKYYDCNCFSNITYTGTQEEFFKYFYVNALVGNPLFEELIYGALAINDRLDDNLKQATCIFVLCKIAGIIERDYCDVSFAQLADHDVKGMIRRLLADRYKFLMHSRFFCPKLIVNCIKYDAYLFPLFVPWIVHNITSPVARKEYYALAEKSLSQNNSLLIRPIYVNGNKFWHYIPEYDITGDIFDKISTYELTECAVGCESKVKAILLANYDKVLSNNAYISFYSIIGDVIMENAKLINRSDVDHRNVTETHIHALIKCLINEKFETDEVTSFIYSPAVLEATLKYIPHLLTLNLLEAEKVFAFILENKEIFYQALNVSPETIVAVIEMISQLTDHHDEISKFIYEAIDYAIELDYSLIAGLCNLLPVEKMISLIDKYDDKIIPFIPCYKIGLQRIIRHMCEKNGMNLKYIHTDTYTKLFSFKSDKSVKNIIYYNSIDDTSHYVVIDVQAVNNNHSDDEETELINNYSENPIYKILPEDFLQEMIEISLNNNPDAFIHIPRSRQTPQHIARFLTAGTLNNKYNYINWRYIDDTWPIIITDPITEPCIISKEIPEKYYYKCNRHNHIYDYECMNLYYNENNDYKGDCFKCLLCYDYTVPRHQLWGTCCPPKPPC